MTRVQSEAAPVHPRTDAIKDDDNMNASVIKIGSSKAKARDTYGEQAKVGGRFSALQYAELSPLQLRFLRKMLHDFGLPRVAKWIGVSREPVLMVAAECEDKCRPDTYAKFREFFALADLESVKSGDFDGRDSPLKRGKTRGKRETR